VTDCQKMTDFIHTFFFSNTNYVSQPTLDKFSFPDLAGEHKAVQA